MTLTGSSMDAILTGRLHHMGRDEYSRLKRDNWSALKHLARSPAHYRHALFSDDVDSDPKKMGRCVHMAVLEPEVFASSVATWDGGTRRGKEWEAFKSANEGHELLTVGERAKCLAIAAAVRGNPMTAPYLSRGRGEVTVLWEYEMPTVMGLPGYKFEMKSRLDFVPEHGPLVDLKMTRDASEEGFGRECANYWYHAQAALYRDAYFAATGEERDYVLVAVEGDAPHVAQVHKVTPKQLQVGRSLYREWLATLNHCRTHGHYPAYSDVPVELRLPRWSMPEDESNLDDVGLIFSQEAR